MRILFFLLLFFFPAQAFLQTTWYVDAEAQGTGNGLNWTNAFTDLQVALGLAQYGDAIWVAQGVYLPSNTGDRLEYFHAGDVRLYNCDFIGNHAEKHYGLEVLSSSGPPQRLELNNCRFIDNTAGDSRSDPL